MKKIALTFACSLALCMFALAWSPSTSAVAGGKGGNDKTTICHRTGSNSNPYVIITISNNALKAHIGDDAHPAKSGRTDHILDNHDGKCPTEDHPPDDCDTHK